MRWLRVLTVIGLVLVTSAVGTGPAIAGVGQRHNALTGSVPAAGEAVPVSPATVTLTFNDTVQNLEPLVTVTSADGSHWEGTAITVLTNQVTAAVNPLGAAGVYTVSYRVVSADGHPVEGSYQFTLAAAGTGSPNPGGSGAVTKSNAIPVWVWTIAATVLIAGLAVLGVRAQRRRGD